MYAFVNAGKSKTYLRETELEWKNAGEGMTRQIMGYDDSLMIVKVAFRKGAIGALHSHKHSQSSYIVSGEFEVIVGEDKKTLKAGDGFYAEPDMLHSCICLEEGVIIDAFSPARIDFLPPAGE